MADKLINKVVFGTETLLDLTGDTVDKEHLLKDVIAHDRSGAVIVGECTFDSDTSDADALANEILEDKTAYANGNKITGTMPNRGQVQGKITDVNVPYLIDNGYHDGTGTVEIDDTEKAKIIATNIKSGVSILGVEGTYEGEAGKGQKKVVAPTKDGFSVLPDEGFDHLTEVEITPIPVTKVENAQGGITCTIA